MKIRIANLPAEVSEKDIRELLDNSDDIQSIEIVAGGETDNPVVIVDMADDDAGEGAIRLVNGRVWKNATLRADRMLY